MWNCVSLPHAFRHIASFIDQVTLPSLLHLYTDDHRDEIEWETELFCFPVSL